MLAEGTEALTALKTRTPPMVTDAPMVSVLMANEESSDDLLAIFCRREIMVGFASMLSGMFVLYNQCTVFWIGRGMYSSCPCLIRG